MGKKEWKKIRHGIIIFVMAFFSAIPFVVYGKNIDSKETIRIGYIDYGGFIDLDENGEYTGYGVELLDKIAEYTGWKYEYVYDTWDNVLKKLESGEIDMICQAQKTPEREERFLLSKYWAGTEACVLYARMDDDRYYYNDYEAFNGIRVAGLKESFQNDDLKEYAQKNDFSFELKEYMTTEECFQALEEGAVDAVVQGSLVGMDDYKIICRFGAQPFYLMAGKQKQKVMEDADYALGEITADYPTFLSELYQKYYGDTSAMGLAFTREEIEYIRAQKQVNIAFINNRPPFSMENDDGEIEGIIVDLVSRIRESSGLNLQYTMLESGQRVIDYLEKHPADLVAGVVVENPAFTKSDYLVSDVIYTGEVALVCRQGMNYTPGDAENKYILAITKSYAALENYIQANYPEFEIVKCTTTEECMELLNSGECDFMAQNVNVVTPLLQKPRYEGLTVLPNLSKEEPMGIVGKNSDENKILMSIINKCITQISSQEVSQITISHTVANGYQLTWTDVLYKFRYPLIVIFILLVASILFMIFWQEARRKSYLKIAEKNEQLLEAVDQANRANQAKSDFLARMSHEIRTPMNAIVGLTEIAKHYEEDPKKIEDYLDKIDVSSKVLLNIINDILDMSSIENKKMKIAKEPFDLHEILMSVGTIYEPQCRQKGIAFEVQDEEVTHTHLIGDGLRVNQILLNLVSNAYKFTPSGGKIMKIAKEPFDLHEILMSVGTIYEPQCRQKGIAFEVQDEEVTHTHLIGDGLRVNQILLNLVSNAYKFTPSGGKITIKVKELYVKEEKAYFNFLVEDTGEGMSEEMQTRLFQPFEQESATTAQKHGGSGLGLSIAKNFVELMSGSISVKSKKGEGTTFVVSIPFEFEQAAEPEITEQPVENGLSVVQEEQAVYDFTGKKVLLAEDTAFNEEVATELLAMVHMDVDCAHNGKEAVELFEKAKPGTYMAILMDIHMPVMNGYEAARTIRKSEREDAGTIAIYAMTANSFEEDVSAALNAGMNGHIAKPIDAQILYEVLDKLAKKQQ